MRGRILKKILKYLLILILLAWLWAIFIEFTAPSQSHVDTVSLLQFALGQVPPTIMGWVSFLINFVAGAFPNLSAPSLNVDVATPFTSIMRAAVQSLILMSLVIIISTIVIVVKCPRTSRQWVSGGKVIPTHPKARVLLMVLIVGGFLLTSLIGFMSHGILGGVFGVLVGVLCIMFRQIPGFPVWFAETIMEVPFSRKAGNSPSLRGGPPPQAPMTPVRPPKPRRPVSARPHTQPRPQATATSHRPAHAGMDSFGSVEEAEAFFQLQDGYSKKAAVSAYRRAAREAHPDAGGANETASDVNQRWQLIKNYHGWR